jgi:hypothetical protein
MAAILAPRVEQLEKDHAILRRDHDCLANEVHDKDTGLPAVNKRLNENDVLSAQVKTAIAIGKWILIALGSSTILLIWNILTHAIEIVRP